MANGNKKCGCIEVGKTSFERNNYFCGKLMVESDFWTEQRYHIGKQWIHNAKLHGWGSVCCLKVDPHPICPNLRVIVRSGMAIDYFGREILVPQEVQVELDSYKKNGNGSGSKPENLYIAISYNECGMEPITAFIDDCGCKEQCEPNRIREGFEIEVLTKDDFEEGELDGYLYSKVVSGKKVISGTEIVDLSKGWGQFDSKKIDGDITIRTSRRSFTVKELELISPVKKLMDIINDVSANKTKVNIEYDANTDRFILECRDKDEVIILEQTGINPFFTDIKMAAYHTEYKKVLNPCPECPSERVILATIEGYDEIKDTHLDPDHADFQTPAYIIDNFKNRKTAYNIRFMDRVINYLAKKGL